MIKRFHKSLPLDFNLNAVDLVIGKIIRMRAIVKKKTKEAPKAVTSHVKMVAPKASITGSYSLRKSKFIMIKLFIHHLIMVLLHQIPGDYDFSCFNKKPNQTGNSKCPVRMTNPGDVL